MKHYLYEFAQILQVLCYDSYDWLGKQLTIDVKRGGTREQCSQKLFEMAEIFRKIIKIFIYMINIIK